MANHQTTAVVQRYLDEIGEVQAGTDQQQLVRELLAKSAQRLHGLCSKMLYRNYPRLTRPPLGLQSEEMLSAVVERLIKALKGVQPTSVREFFGLANQHIRWELNDLARRLDEQTSALPLRDDLVAAPLDSGSQISPVARRLLDAIEGLPDDEREVFGLVRIQGMSHGETAELVGISQKTVQRRLHRGLLLLTQALRDLKPTIDRISES